MIIQVQIFLTAAIALLLMIILSILECEFDVEFNEKIDAFIGSVTVASVLAMVSSFLWWIWL